MQQTQTGQQSKPASANEDHTSSNAHFLKGLARAFGGALIFAFPLLMTMEMWGLGFSMSRMRLLLLMILLLPVLAVLAMYGGFEDNIHWWDAIIDPFIAYAVGFCTATALLALFGVITLAMPPAEIIGKIALHAVPGSLGAMLARNQFGDDQVRDERPEEGDSYWWDLFFHGIGALFLAFNAAPTEEIVLISYQMSNWASVALPIVCLMIIQSLVYADEMRDAPPEGPKPSFWNVFFRLSVVSYALALLVSLYILWTFDRTAGLSLEHIVRATIVLGFPASLGAGAVRLLL